MPDTSLRDVRAFWERSPVASAAIPSTPGSPEFFEHFDRLREDLEPVGLSRRIHEYDAFAGGRVLDVGCGNGYVLSNYARGGADVVGVDLTETGVGLSRRRFEHGNLTGRFLVGSAEDLPFASDSFDCVCSMGVLHHTPDTARGVGELRRVLRPGGLLVVMLYHRNSAVYRRLQLRSRLQHRPVQELVNEVDGVGNPKGDVYTRAEMRALLSGCDDVRCSVAYLRGFPIRGHHFPSRAMLRPLASIWGWNLYAKARKPTRDR